ncbi:MAG TPA: hypothetical protein EYQ18_04680 [Candidatus Handelsmanbacteria bacterium]|nr:hypothetical protein [Candidatus Handelsmanbacteria bacterium]
MRVSLVVLVLGLAWTQAGALTIYRIGGASLPPPALETPYEFVQLNWADVDEGRDGQINLVEVTPDFIRPLRLDPTVNIAPRIYDFDGGNVLVMHSHTGWTESLEDDDGFVFDGDPDTAYLGDGHWPWGSWFAGRQAQWGKGPWIFTKVWVFDLGGIFTLQRIRFFPRDKFVNERFVQRFKIGVSDGDPLKDGTREHAIVHRGFFFDFDISHDIKENTSGIMELELPAEPIQRLLFDAPENTSGIWELAEFEIYGFGFANRATYRSSILDLGEAVSLGGLTWSGQRDTGAEVEFRMRSGDSEEPNNYWRFTFRGDEKSPFDQQGWPLTRQSYDKLNKGEKAGITFDTRNWESWSPAYDFDSGAGAMQADKPRRYVQFSADFRSIRDQGSQLYYLQFAVSDPPIATQVLAEITPGEVAPGQPQAFTYALTPAFNSRDLGFDSIAIDTPSLSGGVDAVRISGQEVSFEVRRLDETGFELAIPRIDATRTGERIEIDFRAEVFQFGTLFSGRVFDSEKPFEVRQALTAGDADPLVDGDRLSVDLLQVGQQSIRTLRLRSAVFTPNGDGVNDLAEIEYDLLNVQAVPVMIEVFDLAGRKVGVVAVGERSSGRFQAAWDGRGAEGDFLPPGTYLLRLVVGTDQGEDQAQAVVGLVY